MVEMIMMTMVKQLCNDGVCDGCGVRISLTLGKLFTKQKWKVRKNDGVQQKEKQAHEGKIIQLIVLRKWCVCVCVCVGNRQLLVYIQVCLHTYTHR